MKNNCYTCDHWHYSYSIEDKYEFYYNCYGICDINHETKNMNDECELYDTNRKFKKRNV